MFVRSLLSDVGLCRETVEQMFPCLDELISVHRALLRSFISRQRQRSDHSVDDVGDLLVKQVSQLKRCRLMQHSHYQYFVSSMFMVGSTTYNISLTISRFCFYISDQQKVIKNRKPKYLTILLITKLNIETRSS